MSILIEEVRIKNFRSLKDVKVSLKPVTLLVGANNAGKTTFLRALNTVLGISKGMLTKEDLFISESGQQNDLFIIIDIKIIAVDNEGRRTPNFNSEWNSIFDGSQYFAEDGGGQYLAFRSKYVFTHTDNPKSPDVKIFSDWENEIATEDFLRIAKVKEALKMYFIDAQRDTQDDVRLRSSYFGKLVTQLEGDYDKNKLEELHTLIETLNEKAIENSPVLSHLKEKLLELNQTTFTTGDGVSISPVPNKIRDLHKGMKVNFQDNGSDTFSMEYHGLGTRSWASILTFGAYISWELSQIERKRKEGEETNSLFPILALEEPEAHLHPNGQRTLYHQLKNFQGQKIISTHSPYIAGQAMLEELRHFYKENDETTVSEIDLGLLKADEKKRIENEVLDIKGDVLFSKAIVLFEGETERQCFPIFAKKYWNDLHFKYGITFISVNGNNYKPFILLANMMNVPWFIFSDYDKPTVKTGVDNILSSVGYENPSTEEFNNVVKLNTSIENYLIDNGYQNELKKAICNHYLSIVNENVPQNVINNEQASINNYNDSNILDKISKGKGKTIYPYYWANEIVKLEDKSRQIPPKIRELFDKISEKLRLKPL